MRNILLAALGAASLSACGDGGGGTLPPVDGQTAPDTVRFLQTSPTFRPSGGVHAVPLLIGESFALSTVQLRATDRSGKETSREITWNVPAPLQLAGGQITAAGEGLVRVVPVAVARTDTLYVLALDNLRARRWVADWTCRRGSYTQFSGPALPADSARWRMVVDSVSYPASSFDTGQLREQNSAAYRIRFFGTLSATVWWRDGSVSVNDATRLATMLSGNYPVQGPWTNQQRVARQYPGALNTGDALPFSTNIRPEWTASRTQAGVYEGGAGVWCGPSGQFEETTFRLTAQN
jgi:predicted small lipoprotein YifL